jgi:hypothetical protein
MADRSADRLEARAEVLAIALETSHTPVGRSAGGPLEVFTYWDNGLDSAPATVRACIESQAAAFGSAHRVLTDRSLEDAVELPGHIFDRRDRMSTAHFSDVLRAHLLAQRGGTWLDATVLASGPIQRAVTDARFVAFTRPNDPFLLSNWFLHSAPAEPLTAAWAAALSEFWRVHDEVSDYFLMHHLFEALVTVDARHRATWENAPHLSSPDAHLMQNTVIAGGTADDALAHLHRSSIHKLSYRLERQPEMDETARRALASVPAPPTL